jgi:hypothetical protein
VPPALDSAFIVSLIAATGVVNADMTQPGRYFAFRPMSDRPHQR